MTLQCWKSITVQTIVQHVRVRDGEELNLASYGKESSSVYHSNHQARCTEVYVETKKDFCHKVCLLVIMIGSLYLQDDAIVTLCWTLVDHNTCGYYLDRPYLRGTNKGGSL